MSTPKPTRTVTDVAADLGLSAADLIPYGTHAAKLPLSLLDRPATGRGKLVLVSAITPTPAGEGKTTVTVGLSLGLRKLGVNVVPCLREPSLGPVFGVKGGGTGGGVAQVVPADKINLHFTGDLHAMTAAHNLVAALIDNERYWRGPNAPAETIWPRVMDMNDRALRDVEVQRGYRKHEPRPDRFDITAASEVMAVMCLATDIDDLRARLGRMVIGWTADDAPITVGDLGAVESMVVLLADALQPNLVQTSEGGPAMVHGGPFANIAHGCSSLLATRMAMHLSDVVVTEAGFGFGLGGEKFLQLKCRQSGLWPDGVVLVATLRALTAHGGGDPSAPGGSDTEALERGLEHLKRQVANVGAFGLKPVIAINVFPGDLSEGHERVLSFCREQGLRGACITAYSDGGEGGAPLGREVMAALEEERPRTPKFLYELEWSYARKIEAVAAAIYGASGIDLDDAAREELTRLSAAGFEGLPVCIAKTPLSLSDDPKAGGLPGPFRMRVREVRLSAGAGFLVVLAGKVMTMPGLPKEPAAQTIHLDKDGVVHGLLRGE